MLDDKKIKEAAIAYSQLMKEKMENDEFGKLCDPVDILADSILYETAFSAGAHWAIEEFLKDLWHGASKEPRNDYGSIIAYSTVSGQGYPVDMNEMMNNSIDNNYSVMWSRIIQANKLDKWLYIDDLLPK